MVEPLIEPEVAVIVVLPVASAVTRPSVPALLPIVATAVFDELHVTDFQRSVMFPSVKLPMALNCCGIPTPIEGLTGSTLIDDSAAAVTVSVVELLIVPEVAIIVVLPVARLVA